jgi:hypothetical protein
MILSTLLLVTNNAMRRKAVSTTSSKNMPTNLNAALPNNTLFMPLVRFGYVKCTEHAKNPIPYPVIKLAPIACWI